MIKNRNGRSSETVREYREGQKTSRKTKMRVYRVAIRPAVTYEVETMILTKGEQEEQRRFERKIYGPKRVVEGA